MNIFIDIPALNNCINPDSFSEICVRCNACGRFDKATQREAALKLYQTLLERALTFDRWAEDERLRELQKKNIEDDVRYYKEKIKELSGGDDNAKENMS